MSRRQARSTRAKSSRIGTTRAASAPATKARRIAGIDAMRGTAIGLMIVYHFCFDLSWFRVFSADFNHDPFWLGFRALIVGMFLLLVGVSLVLADRAGTSRAHFWRRIALVATCAILVSVASYVTFPKTFITFGILHCIVVASILAWPLVRRPWIALVLGVAIVVAGNVVHLALFDAPWLNWVGLMTHKPDTEDYVPLFPWLGVVMIGIAAGRWLVAQQLHPVEPLSRIAPAWLTWLGRHSLIVYMAHQPVMIGILRVLL